MSALRLRSAFATPEAFVAALKALRRAEIRDLEVYAPTSIAGIEELLPRRGSPLRFATLAAGLAGCAVGLWLAIGSAVMYSQIVGGKPPVSLVPFCVIAFEVTILAGGVATLLAILGLSRLRPQPLAAGYRPEFGVDQFGITVCVAADRAQEVADLLRSAGAESVDELTSPD